MKYALFYIPVILLVLAYGYNRKYHRLLHSGRLPEIVTANHRAKLFMILAVISLAMVVIVIVV